MQDLSRTANQPIAPFFRHRTLLAWVAAASLSSGCSNLTVSRINSSSAKPNNVWVFFTVEQGDDPIAGLQANDFKIYEDDQLVSQYESRQTIQNPEIAAVMYTMLLLDVSGSVTESGKTDQLVDAANQFTEQVGKTQKVGVYAFDGEEDIHSVVPFTEAQGSVQGGLEGLRNYKAKDPSTNLNGAVVAGIRELEKALAKDKRPLKFGTLVVFSDGTDRAARVGREEMLEELDKENYQHYEIYAIGVGAELEKANLGEIGKDGTELADDEAKVKDAFARVAARIDAHTKRFYLLSYCSPARKGLHDVRIEAHRPKPKGSGSLEYTFDASKFGPPPDCDPNRQPNFELDNPIPVDDPNDGSDKNASVEIRAKGKTKHTNIGSSD